MDLADQLGRSTGDLVGLEQQHVRPGRPEGYAPLHDVLIAVRRSDVPPKAGSSHAQPWFTVTDTPGTDECSFNQLNDIATRILALQRNRA